MLSVLTACTFPSGSSAWTERNTVLNGDAAQGIQHLYGTYEVVDARVDNRTKVIKLSKSEQGNPLFHFYDRNGQEYVLPVSPGACDMHLGKTSDDYSLTCGTGTYTDPHIILSSAFATYLNKHKRQPGVLDFLVPKPLDYQPGEYFFLISGQGRHSIESELKRVSPDEH